METKKLDFLLIKLDSENYENFLFTLEIIMNGKMQYFWKSYEEIFSKTCLLKKKLKFSKNTKIIKNSKNLEIDEILGIDDIFILINVTKLKFSNFNTIIKKNIKNNDFLKKFVTKLIHEVFFFTHENIYFEKSEHLLIDKNSKIFIPFLKFKKNNDFVLEKNFFFISKQILKILKKKRKNLFEENYFFFVEILKKIYKIQIDNGNFLDDIIIFQQFCDDFEKTVIELDENENFDWKTHFLKFDQNFRNFDESDNFSRKSDFMGFDSLLNVKPLPVLEEVEGIWVLSIFVVFGFFF